MFCGILEMCNIYLTVCARLSVCFLLHGEVSLFLNARLSTSFSCPETGSAHHKNMGSTPNALQKYLHSFK